MRFNVKTQGDNVAALWISVGWKMGSDWRSAVSEDLRAFVPLRLRVNPDL
jgi:hypothetical protein